MCFALPVGNKPNSDVAFETVQLALARVRVDNKNERADAMQSAAEICSQALQVERVGVWLFDEGENILRCKTMFLRSENRHDTTELILTAADAPNYWKSLRERRAIVAHDAIHSPATAELADGYLKHHSITSLLDAPIIRNGVVAGVVCHEHVGPQRTWSVEEVGLACAIADLTSNILEQALRAEAEAKLRQRASARSDARRLEMIGQVSGAIGHDFVSIVTAVGLIAARLQREGTNIAQAGAELEECSRMGTDLARRLTTFAARDQDRSPRCQVEEVLSDLLPVVRTLIGESVTIRVDLEENLDLAVPRIAVEQILLNLCLNSAEAMRRVDGVIRISARRLNGSIELQVVDNGAGIPPLVLARIFDPYFTTRVDGTGLGLATVKDLTEEYGGTISVESTVGDGTKFQIVLPAVG